MDDPDEGNPDNIAIPSYLRVGYLVTFLDDSQWFIDNIDSNTGIVSMHGFNNSQSQQSQSIQWCINSIIELMFD